MTIDLYFLEYERFQKWWNEHASRTGHMWQESYVRRTAVWVSALLSAITILFAGLLSSFSRGAAAVFLVALIIYASMKVYQNKVRATVLGIKLVLVGAFVFFVWVTLFPGLWTARFSNDRLETISIEKRISGYKEASALLRQYPLFGTGLGHYTIALAKREPGHETFWYQPVHNVPLLVLDEIGFIGVGLLFFVYWKHLKNFFHYLYHEANALAVASFVSLVVLGLTDHYLWSLHAGLLLAAMTVVLCKKEIIR